MPRGGTSLPELSISHVPLTPGAPAALATLPFSLGPLTPPLVHDPPAGWGLGLEAEAQAGVVPRGPHASCWTQLSLCSHCGQYGPLRTICLLSLSPHISFLGLPGTLPRTGCLKQGKCIVPLFWNPGISGVLLPPTALGALPLHLPASSFCFCLPMLSLLSLKTQLLLDLGPAWQSGITSYEDPK